MEFTIKDMTFTAHNSKDITEMELGFCAASIVYELGDLFFEEDYETDVKVVFVVEVECGEKWFSFETFDFENFELI
jgi:hypothetical protein